MFLEPLKAVSLSHTFVATSIGFGSVFIFGRAGEIVRPLVLSLREGVRPSVTIATILIERVFDMSAVAIIFAVNLLFELPAASSIDARTPENIHRTGIVLTIAVAVGIGLLVLFRTRATGAIEVLERYAGLGSGTASRNSDKPGNSRR